MTFGEAFRNTKRASEWRNPLIRAAVVIKLMTALLGRRGLQRMRWHIASTISAGAVAAALLWTIAARAQQPPARPRSGGFTEPDPVDFNDHTGWISMFDGKSLEGWDGDKSSW